MKRSRFTEEQVLAILKEGEAGGTVKEVCRRHGVSPATYYKWKSKYGGLASPAPSPGHSHPIFGQSLCHYRKVSLRAVISTAR